MDCTRKFLDSKARVVRGQIYKKLFAHSNLRIPFQRTTPVSVGLFPLEIVGKIFFS